MPGIDHAKVLAAFSIASGVLSIALLLILGTPSSASSQLVFFQTHQSAYLLAAVLALVWAIVSVPFILTLGTILRERSRILAQSAMVLSLFGVLFYAFAVYVNVGTLMSINNELALAPAAAEPTYQAAILYDLAFLISDPPLMVIGFAQVVLGWLAWRSGILPNWLAAIGVIGGVAGLMTIVVYQTNLLALVQVGSFAIWGLTIGALLLRNRNR
jgi:hypothetical protein